MWEPISTAPMDRKTLVLTYDPSAPEDERIRVDRWDYLGRDDLDNSVYGWDGSPTHWMPLPEPPASQRC